MANYPFYGQPMQQPIIQQPMQQQFVPQNQIQNGGFMTIPSEEMARNYPVALGNSVTFKNENAPYVYVKTMGFSQLDAPVFKKYKLVEETYEEKTESTHKDDENKNPMDNTINELKGEIKALWSEIKGLKNRKPNDKNGGN